MSALRETCSGLPDKRRGTNCRYVMADIGMAAFSVFFMQSPSFLAHQRHLTDGYGHGRSNCETLFGMERIPSDNHVRDMLDPVAPECFHALFPRAVKALEAGGGLTAFRRLGDHVLIAFDGTEYHRSTKLHCACCSTRKRSGGTTEYFHALVAATLVAPGHSRVVPLEPEFVVPQDGHDKQDCESMAARRWLAAHGPSYARLDPVYLGDDLYSRQPLQAVVSSDHRGIPDRGRTGAADKAGQAWRPAVHSHLSMAMRGPVARRRRRHDGQLADDRDPQRRRRGDLSQQLHHRPAHRSRHRRRIGGLRPGTLEDRERKLQYPEKQGL